MSTTIVNASNRLAGMVAEFATSEGFTQSKLEAVRFMRSNRSHPRSSVVYEPSIVIIAQGRKRGYLGGQVYTYDALNYLVLSVPLPFECETEGSIEEPLLGISVRVDAAMVAELLLELDDHNTAKAQGIGVTPLSDDLLCAAERLLECLKSDADCRILGPSIVREIIYRVLLGEQGDALRALVSHHTNFSSIARSLKRIHQDYSKSLDVELLASEAGMSVSAFHHNFKVVTATAPIQYIKTIRLHKARMMMVHDGLKANLAASQVGYESASQFSREFKRLFGKSPAEETARMRALL